MGYFAQHHSDMLNPRKTVIEEVYQVVPRETTGFVRNVCGAFLFSGQEVDKAIGILSGGERARVSLAKLLVKPGNLMVMDEPTNHLDITSAEKLIDALEKYRGSLLFVSHNQSFVNRLATKIWDINNGEVTEYHGTLDEYYDHLSNLQLARTEPVAPIREDQVVSREHNLAQKKKKDRRAEKRVRAEMRRLIHDTLNPIRMTLEQTEKRISELEMKQKDLEQRLADPDIFKDTDESVPLLNEYHEIRETLEGFLLEWERLQEELDRAKLKLGIRDDDSIDNEEGSKGKHEKREH
jgi:ATP-binding cassette subfamily F protein 3